MKEVKKVEKGKKENKILIFSMRNPQCAIRNVLSKTTMKVILASLMFLCGLACAAEEVNPRRMDKEGFEQMQRAGAYIIYEEGKNRQNHFGFGASGTFLMRFENWTTTNLNDGFVDLELNYCINPFMYAELGAGYHATSDRRVFPVYGSIQFVVPAISALEEIPSSAGISLGVINYSSSITAESVTSFKIGIVSYKFFDKNTAWETSIEWITPDFRNNNIVIKTGPKFFWM